MSSASQHRIRRLAAALTIVLGTLTGCGSSGESGNRAWPDVELLDLAGASTSSADVVGDGPTVVSLWAVWCQPCRRELPALADLSSRRDDVKVVTVNIGDDADAIAAYLSELGVDLPTYVDLDGVLLTRLQIPVVPATVVVDRSGEVAWLHLGEITAAEVESAVGPLAAAQS